MTSVPWAEARATAWQAAAPPATVARPLGDSIGHILGEPLVALTDLPSFDTSAMDGWAVAGAGPWKVYGQVLAGDEGEPLGAGEAVAIATGARIPDGTSAVLRSEHGALDGGTLTGDVEPGSNIRRRSEECTEGDVLLARGARVSPAVLGLAAASGYDELPVVERPTVAVFVVGDELLGHGVPHGSRIRDALGPMLPSWLTALGARVRDVRHLPDAPAGRVSGPEAETRDGGRILADAAASSDADLIVTTGGTAYGPADNLRAALERLGGDLLVDGVQVRPGHPMLLARLGDGRLLAGLPGNPLAAVTGFVTLAEPIVAALSGIPELAHRRLRLTADATGHPTDTRIFPVQNGAPLHRSGPAMLRGLAEADALAAIPPGGASAGEEVEHLPLPWATG